MLAMNYRTADELGITEEQRAALIKTLGFFERGEVPEGEFDMGQETAGDFPECGTAVCILGWCNKLVSEVGFTPRASVLSLFYPHEPAAANCRDPALGAHALRNYLTRPGDPWEGVLS